MYVYSVGPLLKYVYSRTSVVCVQWDSTNVCTVGPLLSVYAVGPLLVCVK